MARDEVHIRHTLFLHAAGQPRQEAWQPRADIYRVPGGWLVKFELAGVRPEDVRLTVRGSTLLVEGTRRDELLQEALGCHCMEIAYSRFERSLDLSGVSETARIEAAHRAGMLLVRIVTEGTP
jgi:HSP20 family protein